MIRDKVADLDLEIAKVTNPEERVILEARRKDFLAQVPTWTRVKWRWVGCAAVVYLLCLVPPALFFHQTLRQMGQKPRRIDSVSAHVLGHVGKYVPGKAMVVVLRVSAITGEHVRGAVATVAVFVETLVMMAVGGTLSGVLVLSLDMPMWIRLLAIGLAVCASVPTLPPLFQLVVDRVAKLKLGVGSGLEQAKVTWMLMIRGWAWASLMWIGIGVSFFLLLQAVPGVPNIISIHDFLLSTAAISLAMVAGFVSLLPGGAGVRELVLSTVLAPRFGVVPALAAAVLARLTFLFVELSVGGVLWYAKQRKRR